MTVGTDTVRIGRVGAALGPVDPKTVDFDGSRMTFSGDIYGTTATEAQAYMEQLRGYVDNPDEPFVPVLWSGVLPNISGFYRIDSMSASQTDVLTKYTYTLTMERVRGFAAPLFETRILGAKRTGVAAGVTAVAWHAVPLATKGYDNVEDPTATGSVRYSEDGYLVELTDTSNSTFDTTINYYLPPASWYTGAATITVDGYQVVGRQCANTPEDWTLSNGLVRISGGGPPVNTGEADMGLTLERWNSTTSEWVSLGNWYPGYSNEAAATNQNRFDAPHAITVLRNSPECASIRLSYEDGSLYGSGTWAANVDLTLRRGSKVVEVVEESRLSKYFFLRAPNAFSLSGATSGTGALIDTTTGQVVALGNGAFVTGTNLVQLSTAATRLVAGIGHSISAAYNAAAATALAARHAAAQVESVQVVAR